MKGVTDLLDLPPYSLNKAEKKILLNPCFSDLCRHHYYHCEPYRKMMDAISFDVYGDYKYNDVPFIPVRFFKLYDLHSVPNEKIIKTVTSSGTSGQAVSKIYLDKNTSTNQTKALAKIVTSCIGSQRLPMIIVDSENVIKDRNLFTARGAGIMGFSLFGSKRMYALNGQMELNLDQLISFTEEHKGEQIFMFGFTFMVYHHFYKALANSGSRIDLSNAVLIHGGGWKKLTGESVSSGEFRKRLHDVCGISSVYDYYGMAEQTGSIFMECEQNHFHASVYSDVIIRRAVDFSMADMGEKGIVQVLSILPESYPGHSLLTEDEGVLLGEDDCPCGRLGKYFKITGRLKNAETRGCSDTYATDYQ